MKPGYMYIITNEYNTTLYIGTTSDLHQRVKEHQHRRYTDSFSARYNLNKLVYFEPYQLIEDAIAREKQVKAGSRAKKVQLIEKMNPEWKDLIFEIEKYL